jgi:hypothetical protein
VKNPVAVSPRVPAQRYSALGESVPKARLKSVVDGKQVNIPVPLYAAMGGRRKLGVANCWMLVQAFRQARKANPPGIAET